MFTFSLINYFRQTISIIFQLDVVAFAHVAQIYFLDKEVEWALRDYMIESCPNLVGHVSRMKERCFADWDDICRSVETIFSGVHVILFLCFLAHWT